MNANYCTSSRTIKYYGLVKEAKYWECIKYCMSAGIFGLQ